MVQSRWKDAPIREPENSGIRFFSVNKDKNVELIIKSEAGGGALAFRLMLFMADLQHFAQTPSHLIMKLFWTSWFLEWLNKTSHWSSFRWSCSNSQLSTLEQKFGLIKYFSTSESCISHHHICQFLKVLEGQRSPLWIAHEVVMPPGLMLS